MCLMRTDALYFLFLKHMLEQDHIPNWNKCTILGFETNFYKRRLMESLFINNWSLTINEKSFVDFLKIYCNLKNEKMKKLAIRP